MPPITTSFDTFVTRDPSLAEVMYRGAAEDEIYKDCVDVVAWTKEKFKYPDRIVTHSIAGLGPMYRRHETGTIQMDTPAPGATKETAYTKFGLGVEFSEDLQDDGMYGIVEDVVEDLGRTYSLTRNIQTGQLYDDAFTGAYYTGPDGQPILSSNHTSYGGGAAMKNAPSVAVAFSYQGVQDVMTLMRRQTDDRGNPRPALRGGQSIQVIIPPEMEFKADTLFNEGAALDPTTNNNTVNVLKSNRWRVTVNPYMTSTTAFFLVNPDDKGIWLVDRKPLERDFYMREETKGVVYDARARWGFHVKDWRGHYGSNG